MSINKTAIGVSFGLAAFAGCFAWAVQAALNAPSDVSFSSPSGQYVIESVPLSGLLSPSGGMAYLRIINKEHPGRPYRTPLYSIQSLDMRSFENTDTVGVRWVLLDKREPRYRISIPQWRPHWLDQFISNTPYEVEPNG